MSSTKTTLLAVFVLVVTFAAGMAAGTFLAHVRLLRGEPPRFHEMRADTLLNRLDRRLDLTDAQRIEIKKIIDRRHQRIMSITTDVRPSIHKEIVDANAEIEKVLTPEQRKRWDKIKMRLIPPGHLVR